MVVLTVFGLAEENRSPCDHADGPSLCSRQNLVPHEDKTLMTPATMTHLFFEDFPGEIKVAYKSFLIDI